MSMMEAAHVLETHPETEYQDRPIKCVDCNENFIWTAGEQVFFHDKGLKNEPKRCKPCKQAKNERLAAIAAAQTSGVRQRIEVSVQCAQCGQQTTVPFYPSQGRPEQAPGLPRNLRPDGDAGRRSRVERAPHHAALPEDPRGVAPRPLTIAIAPPPTH